MLNDVPSLDIDDVNGAGPEIISIVSPESPMSLGGPYRVGVHCYRATLNQNELDERSSDARLSIFFEGALAFESVKTLRGTNDLWTVADIVWTQENERVVEVDEAQRERWVGRDRR